MTKENKQYVASKKSSTSTNGKNDKKSKETKRDNLVSKKKQNHQSDSSDFDDSSDFEDEEEMEMDEHEYRMFLSKLFPSKHLNEKINAGEKVKKILKEDKKQEKEKQEKGNKQQKQKKSKSKKEDSETEDDDDNDYEDYRDDHYDEEDEETIGSSSSSEDEVIIKKKNLKSKKSKKSKKQVFSDSEEEESSDEDEKKHSKRREKVNIILSIGGDEDYDEDDEDWEDYEDDDEETEDEDVSVSSDSSSEEEKEEDKEPIKKSKKSLALKTESPASPSVAAPLVVLEEETDEFLLKLKELYESNKKNKSIQKCIEAYEQEMKDTKKKREKKEKKQKAKHTRIFRRIIRDKNTMNDFTFFEKLELDAQKKMIKELREINKMTRVEKPYRMTLLEATIPPLFKAAAMKKINSLRYMEPGSGEYYKIKTWVDTFMHIPFDQYKNLPIHISDGVEKCHDFMENAKQILDDAVYGLNDAKMQIMQMLGQLVTNPKAIGTSIAINGPPGTGKTSLVKEGISKILNRPFAFIALGGATDSSFLEGHSYTYEGSMWGKIVQILIDSKCMNPVIYFDELDKISDTPKGEEIAGILTHLTDTTQNSQFHDKYFSEIDFDLSKCLFIFSYNDESKINPILKDRMYRIQTKGYDKKQKTIISNDYLLPKIREQVCFHKEDITIPDETVHYMIDNFCNKEDGVRNLKRCLEIIYTKLNLYRLMRPGSNLFEEDMSIQVEFPFQVTTDMVKKLIKVDDKDKLTAAMYSMYI
jgi:ATP-dependent Lon protease